jgi:M6 family metalloprotease-like protein
MKKKYILLFFIFINFLTWPQDKEIFCSSKQSESKMDALDRGGKFLTATGKLKVLVVFAKFKDDNTEHQYWPINSYPNEMNAFIDPDIQSKSTHFINLTNYYNQMSCGNFNVTGKTIGVETPYPISHYIPGIKKYPDRTQATKDILRVVDDSIDYHDFDNWTYIRDYNNINAPDSIVDMIVIIWRGLVFCESWTGESSLGGGQQLMVENNHIKIRMGCGGNADYGIFGSGVTIQYWGERSPERNFKTVIHELAHWLINGGHPYKFFKHTFWGMLTLGGEGICANSFEREKLGWLDPIPIEETILRAPMDDYVTTASAYKYQPVNGDSGETFYFENHQQVSIYDNGISNPDDKGIFILHLENNLYLGDCSRILTSDGFWTWDSPYSTDCWGNYLRSFKKKNVNRNGFGNRDKISVEDSLSEFLYSYINENNQNECNDWLHGYGSYNSFNTYFNDVFSRWSNPPAKTWSGQPTDFMMEVITESEGIVTARFVVSNSIDEKPSKPALGLDPHNINYQYRNGWIYLAWGADLWDGLPIEPDIEWSELQIKINSEDWTTVYSGEQRYWADSSFNFDSTGNIQALFRVRVKNSQNQWSIWSSSIKTSLNSQMISAIDSNSIKQDDINVSDYALFQNYPNPFNSSTKISWQSPVDGWHTIKIYDVLGNEIAVLVDEYKQTGRYTVEFSTKNLASAEISSGVYFYRITILSDKKQSLNFTEVKKMILLR